MTHPPGSTGPRPPAIVLVGLSLSTGLPAFVEASHALGAEVMLIHEPFEGNPDPTGSLAQLHRHRLAMVDEAVEVARIDPVRALTAVHALTDRYEVQGVYSGSEKDVEVVARAAAVYGLPGPGLRAASISRNKLMQRLLCRRHGVPVPAFTAVFSAEEARAFLADHAPVVAKPCAGWASAGVRRLDSMDDLDAHLAELYAADGNRFPFLLEEYLTGREVSVDCLVLDGQPMLTSVTHKGKGAEPYFVETLQVVPAALPGDQRAAFHELAARIIGLTGMETGVLHLEAIGRGNSTLVYPVEWAVREPGHAIMDLINWRFGGRATPYLVGIHLGAPTPELPVERSQRIAVTVFIELPPGTVLQVRRDHDPTTIRGMVEFDFYAAAGDVIAPARDNWSTQGGYSVLADDLADLRRALDELDEAFGVLIRAEDGQETWVRASSQVRSEVLDPPSGDGPGMSSG